MTGMRYALVTRLEGVSALGDEAETFETIDPVSGQLEVTRGPRFVLVDSIGNSSYVFWGIDDNSSSLGRREKGVDAAGAEEQLRRQFGAWLGEWESLPEGATTELPPLVAGMWMDGKVRSSEVMRFSLLRASEDPPRAKHYLGLPPELTANQDHRVLLPRARAVAILKRLDRYCLYRFGRSGPSGSTCTAGNTWHASVEEAVSRANWEFGGLIKEWLPIPPTRWNPLNYPEARLRQRLSLEDGLHDPHPQRRAAAARLAGELGWIEDAPALRSVLDDESWDVRRDAVNSLARLGDRSAVPLIRNLAADPEPHVRMAVAAALGSLGDGGVLGVLENMCCDPVPGVRVAAARALGMLGRCEARPTLERLLKDFNPRVRSEAKRSLGYLEHLEGDG